MNNKFLDKVYDQILSETRIDGKGLIHSPFLIGPLPIHEINENYFFPLINQRFYFHCKEVYSLNKGETEYIWTKYKEGIVLLMEKKELSYE